MLTQSQQIGFSYWFQWIMLNAVGWALGMTIRQFLFGFGGWAVNLLVVGSVIGAAVGIAQLFSLTQPGYRAGWWVLASIIGWALGWGIGWGTGWSIFGGLGFMGAFGTVGALGGAASGVIQWVILRQQVHQAGWWILGGAAGWAAGLAIGVTVGGAFGWAIAGAVSGIITGLVLVWLLRNPVLDA